jgi:5-methylthioadenosine/S-adenosylhomocysteine deaminase
MGVQLTVDNRRKNRDLRVGALDGRHAFGRGDDADQAKVLGSRAREHVERRHGAAAGREHRVDQQHVAAFDVRRQFGVILRCHRGAFIALQAEMSDARVGNEFEHAWQHPKPGTKDRRNHDIDGDTAARSRTQRRLNLDFSGGHITQCLSAEQHADAIGERAESLRSGVHIAQASQTIVNKRMMNKVQHSGQSLHAISRFTYNSGRMRRTARFACITFGIVLAAACQRPSPASPPSPNASPRASPNASLIVANGIVVTMDDTRRLLTPGSVVIDGTRIVAVDRPDAIAAKFTAAETIDATGKVVMPGLINTHTHAAMVMYRGLADDLALMEWLQKYIFPAEAKTLSPEFVRVGTRLAALEMIRSGTTTYTDMYYFEEEVGRVTREAGLRGVLGQSVIEFPVADAKTPAEALTRAEAFINEFKDDDLIVPALAPHSAYTLDAAVLTQVRDLAMKYHAPVLIHLAETKDEIRMVQERTKERPVAFLDRLKFWGPLIVAAHGVWITPDEIAVLKKNGVGVSHNPESNMKLASGIAPVPGYLLVGVKLGLGTDGAASNNDLDMFEAMRQAAFLHKIATGDPRVVSAYAALNMATRGGAAVIGQLARLGSLEAGKQADLIVVGMDRARQTPMYDPVSHLVYATHGDDVEVTIVNGRVLMKNGKVQTLDEPRVLAEARAAAEQVRKAVGREAK